MLRYLLPSVAIVGACLAVYATSLHAPPAEDQLTFVPVVPASPPPPAHAQPEPPAVPASLSAPTPAQPEPVKPAPIHGEHFPTQSSPATAWAPLGGHSRPNLHHSNRGPPSIHELLQSAQAALAGNNAPLVRRLQELGNRLRFAMCRDLRCYPHRDFASHNRRSYWPAYSSYWRPSHDGFRSEDVVSAKHPGNHRKDDDDD